LLPDKEFTLYSSCVSKKPYDAIDKQIGKFHLDIPLDLKYEQLMDHPILTCNKKHTKAAYYILPKVRSDDIKPIVYHNCNKTNYCVFLRQHPVNYPISEKLLKQYHTFVDQVYLPKILALLKDFKYCPNGYYNSLEAVKQKEQDKFFDGNRQPKCNIPTYEMMAKIQKQLADEKIRSVSQPTEDMKYIMGPVIKYVEQIMMDFLPSYSPGKNWADKEKQINEAVAMGFTISASTDATGFDRTIDNELKYIGFRVYDFLEPFITHVTFDLFASVAKAKKKQIYVNDSKAFVKMLVAIIIGTVNSGSIDTTILNTWIMDSGTEFAAYIAKLVSKNSVSGDDANALFKNATPKEIAKAYYDVFPTNPTPGLGIQLKHLLITTPEDALVCSTERYVCDKHGIKLSRDLLKYIENICLNVKAINYTEDQRKQLCRDLAEADFSWAGNSIDNYEGSLPIIRAFTKKLYEKGSSTKSIQTGKTRVIKITNLPLTRENVELKEKFGHDYYAIRDRKTSVENCCVEGFYNMLNKRYGLSKATVTLFEKEIEEAVMEIDGTVYDMMKTNREAYYLDKFYYPPKVVPKEEVKTENPLVSLWGKITSITSKIIPPENKQDVPKLSEKIVESENKTQIKETPSEKK